MGVTSYSIGRQLGVSGGPTAGDLFSLTLTGMTLQAGGSGATLTLSSGDLTVYSFVGTADDVYAAGSNLSLSATLGPVSGSATGVSFLYNPSTVTDLVVRGWAGERDGADVLGVGWCDELLGQRARLGRCDGLLDRSAAGCEWRYSAGDLFSLTLTGINLQAGGANATLTISSGNLTVYSFVGSQTDVYAAGSNLSLSATLGPVSASSSDVAFVYNPSTVTDWSFAGGPASVTAQTFSVSGGSTSFSVSGLGSVGVDSFSIGRQLGASGPGGSGGSVQPDADRDHAAPR